MYINDRYEIIMKVGSGGMADVYKARDKRLNRFVAIKVLKAEYSNDTSFVMKFRVEAQSAAGLSHPNIVNVYDVGDEDGLYYIVMELVEGITLKNFIERKGNLEIREAVGIAIQIAQGLEAAHANHIIHRDIKPQNIIISKEGKVKVTDFGIAKAATSNTINSNAMGSVHYISPEQARGGYSDEKSDIYSLGVTLYEMLSGRVPFAGDNTVSVALAHIQSEATPLRQINSEIPISLEQIVCKCMDKKPERRYLSAAELITDLKRSIVNPNGDFVKIVSAIVDDSPTINLSKEEVHQIKSATSEPVYQQAENVVEPQPTKVVEVEKKPQVEEENEVEEIDSDEEETEIDPKLDRIIVVSGIVLAVILAAIIFIIAIKFLGLFSSGKGNKKLPVTPAPIQTEQVTQTPEPTPEETQKPEAMLPEIVGMGLQQAVAMLEERNIQYTYKADMNSSAEADTVTAVMMDDHEISSGTLIPADARVVVYYSTGANTITIPSVAGKRKSTAVLQLQNTGIDLANIKIQEEYSDTVEAGLVIYTTPGVGEKINKMAVVTVYVSKGAEQVTVPSLLGKTKSEAKAELAAAGLKLGDQTYDYSDGYEKGKVMSQGIEAGKEVSKGSTIDIVISQGPEATPTVEPTQTPQPTVEPTATPAVYRGSVSISPSWVFEEGQEKDEQGNPISARVEAYVTVEGQKIPVVSGTYNYTDFPITKDLTSPKSGEYVLTIIVDGKKKSGTHYVDFN